MARRITRRGWRRKWYAITWPPEVVGPLITEFVEQMVAVFGRKSAAPERP